MRGEPSVIDRLVKSFTQESQSEPFDDAWSILKIDPVTLALGASTVGLGLNSWRQHRNAKEASERHVKQSEAANEEIRNLKRRHAYEQGMGENKYVPYQRNPYLSDKENDRLEWTQRLHGNAAPSQVESQMTPQLESQMAYQNPENWDEILQGGGGQP
tara:strand:+ start:316 stop:789 length:474 start_codon:yes stop_codon:yes gene_type:complete